MCIFRERPTLMSGSDRLTDPAMILRAFDQGAVRMEVLWNEMLISCAHGRDIFPVWVSLQRDFLDIVERTQIRMNLGLSPTSLAMPTLMDELLKGTFARSG
ncbi:MAG TPA: hypothetical protein VMR98_01705 [Candidatus Polarisedimenticolaceae bacterium]|nr:hypothetical protein [Candidatus Polarisedimenticolaceae bacterium]